MSPEIPEKSPVKHVSISLPKNLVKAIDTESKKKGQSRSMVIATLLAWALEQAELKQ